MRRAGEQSVGGDANWDADEALIARIELIDCEKRLCAEKCIILVDRENGRLIIFKFYISLSEKQIQTAVRFEANEREDHILCTHS